MICELPRVLVAVCTCSGELSEFLDSQEIVSHLLQDPSVERIEFLEQTCTADGWESLVNLVEEQKPNRILIGTCLPYVYARKLRELGLQVGLAPSCMDVVDIRTPLFSSTEQDKEELGSQIISTLKMGVAKLKRIEPTAASTVRIHQQALVAGGGIAGMTAALAIADHGFQVDLVEKAEKLGGNLLWLRHTLEGHDTQVLLEETCQKIEKHPLVKVHTGAQIINSYGEVGLFFTTIEDAEGVAHSLEHAVSILATGGTEATTVSYGNGTN